VRDLPRILALYLEIDSDLNVLLANATAAANLNRIQQIASRQII